MNGWVSRQPGHFSTDQAQEAGKKVNFKVNVEGQLVVD